MDKSEMQKKAAERTERAIKYALELTPYLKAEATRRNLNAIEVLMGLLFMAETGVESLKQAAPGLLTEERIADLRAYISGIAQDMAEKVRPSMQARRQEEGDGIPPLPVVPPRRGEPKA